MSYKVSFVGAHAHEHTPPVALYAVDLRGRIGAKIAVVTEGSLTLPRIEGDVVALGPDVEEIGAVDPKALVLLRLSDQVPLWEQDGTIEVPSQWWRGWLWFTICVSGRVFRCFPFWLRQPQLRAIGLGRYDPVFPDICQPLCNAMVEVWESTTCCWPLLVPQVQSVIANLERFVLENPIMFPVPPQPDPGPVERGLVTRVDQALGAGKIDRRFAPNAALSQHLALLKGLRGAEAVSYIEANPSLWWFHCTPATTAKLGEAPLNPDGSFSFCYRHFPFFLLNCRTSYFYKVRQLVDGIPTVIYDGGAAHQFFTADQIANLYTWTGQTCFQPPSLGEDTAAFQAIGSTSTSALNSHWSGAVLGVDQTQTGAMTLTTPPQDGGLVVGSGAPWGGGLGLLMNFDAGLKALGAVYYRITVTQADSSGGPLAGAPMQVLNTPVSWQYYDTSSFPITTPYRPLGPNTVTSGAQVVSGLYTIPYQDGTIDWFGNQFHQVLDTTQLPNSLVYAGAGPGPGNGRYLVTLDIFDVNGNRLVPSASPAPAAGSSDVAAPFSYLRQLDTLTTAVVPFGSLTHLIWVDNRQATGRIDYFGYTDGGSTVVSSDQCQFLTASADAYFQVGYRASHHVMCDAAPAPRPTRSFMASYALSCEEGLNGTPVSLDGGGDTNNPNPAWPVCPDAVADAVSPMTSGSSFGALLGTHAACAFGITLSVTSKHTTGSGPVFDPYTATSSVALSV